jgi:hypothetical protein
MRIALLVVMAGLGLALILTGIKELAWREEQEKLMLPLVDLPLPMSVHEFAVGGFTAPKDADYLVLVSAERAILPNTSDCLLGTDHALLDKCVGISTALNAAWSVTTDGRQIAHGSLGTERLTGLDKRVIKPIGRFSGRRGQLYKLDMKSLADTSRLNSENPHIEVFYTPPDFYDEYGISMRYALAKPVGVTSLLVGAVLFIFGVLISALRTILPR